MHYLVMAKDKEGALEQRLALRADHVSYWEGLASNVRLAGAMLGSDSADATACGSALVIEADSEAAVREMLAADPFASEGIFADDLVICRIRPALGTWIQPG